MRWLKLLVVLSMVGGCGKPSVPPSAVSAQLQPASPPDQEIVSFLKGNIMAGWKDLPDSAPLENVPQIVATEQTGEKLTVTIRNTGKTTLTYAGSSPTEIQLYDELFEDGVWKQMGYQWCGTGMENYSLRPGQSVDLHVKFWSRDYRDRMLAYFREQGTERAGLVVLATESEE
ncbi:MAG TPA: hypothetical protein VL132_22275 [Planctomycetaceae bacterium]|nr:hypothetical protein [Planctomycetaceae bacterium]